jgi:hypothetical protein
MSGVEGGKPQQRIVEVATSQSLTITGFNDDINTATVPEDVWPVGGLVAYPAAADQVSMVSDDAADTIAGTGAQLVQIEAIDANLNVVTEIMALNGTTPVLSVGLFLAVNGARVISTGSGGKNAGVITFTIDSNLNDAIAIGKNLSSTCFGMMPKPEVLGTTPHLTSFTMFVGKQQNALVSMSLVFKSALLGHEFEAFNIPFSSNGAPIQVSLNSPVAVLPGDIGGMRVLTSSANAVLVAGILQFTYL